MCKILTLFFATLTNLTFQCFTMEDNIEKNLKKEPCQYIQKLLNLKHKQEELFYQNKFEALEEITCEIGALLTFKDYLNNPNITYRKATKAEAQIILSAIAQNRRIYKGVGNMMERFYMFDNAQGKEKINQDLNYAKHIASLAWADSISHQVFNNVNFHPSKDDDKDFYDWLNEQKEKNNIDKDFKDYVLNAKDIFNKPIHPNYIQQQIQNLSDENWNNLTENLGLVLDIFAPELDILDLSEGTKIVDGKYKGWEVHGVDALGAWCQSETYYTGGSFRNKAKDRNEFLSKLRNKKAKYGENNHCRDLSTSVSILCFQSLQNKPKESSSADKSDKQKEKIDEFFKQDLLVLEYVLYVFDQKLIDPFPSVQDTFHIYLTKNIDKRLAPEIFSNINSYQKEGRISNHKKRIELFNLFEREQESSRHEESKIHLKEAASLGHRLAIDSLRLHHGITKSLGFDFSSNNLMKIVQEEDPDQAKHIHLNNFFEQMSDHFRNGKKMSQTVFQNLLETNPFY